MTNFSSPTVLLVDDDPSTRVYLMHLLVHEGYRVVEAEEGEQALVLYSQSQPQIVLLDALMPGMDGFECCQKLQVLDADLPCLMITSLEDQASVDKAFAAGASDYITKPIHWPVMRQRIHHLLKARQNLLNVRQQAAREQALNRVIRAIRTSLELDKIFSVATREICHLLEADRVSISRYQPQQQEWCVISEYQTQADGYLGCSIPDSDNRMAQLLKQGKVVTLETVSQAKDWICIPSMAKAYPGSWLLAPLYGGSGSSGRVSGTESLSAPPTLWGSLCLQLKTARSGWLATSHNLILTLADHLSIAIQQAELFQQIQELNHTLEEKVQARTAQLDRQVQELQRLDHLKNDFLSTVSHELRTPLSSIKMGIRLLSSALLPSNGVAKPPDPEKVARYLDVLNRECEREIKLVEDLLELQRLEVLIGSQQPHWLDLKEWLPPITDPFAEVARSYNQLFSLEYPPDLPPICTLPEVLRAVLAELLQNAHKFTPTDQLISLSVHNHPDHLEIQILNTGVTIPPQEQERVFEKFYRVPNPDPWRQGGTGLGLALVQKRMNLLQGSIHLSSEAEHTCFTLRLPWVLSISGKGKLAQPKA
ncbi:response regulator [Synechococcus sp. Nb3U1]|uniref:response regulator n=1 Tax=Synechococcus sp. Nb3U1 TaxID=1914529 RepID=UPI001F349FE2|nr:response regulator [Synechococcus sp. Nb3U1]MCF2971482.1 response regulator [Synechococcus sp. Nb3U1]